MPRPSDFTEQVLEEICDRLSRGEPLAVICRDDHMPSDRTVRNWMNREDFGPQVSSAIARAREVGFDQIAADCLLIADGRDKPDLSTLADQVASDTVVIRDHNRDKLRIETRLKLLAKWDPKRYGEKVDVAHSGGVRLTKIELVAAEAPGEPEPPELDSFVPDPA